MELNFKLSRVAAIQIVDAIDSEMSRLRDAAKDMRDPECERVGAERMYNELKKIRSGLLSQVIDYDYKRGDW